MEKAEEKSELLTAEEAAVYDRQIRLWGVEAQQRLRQAKVLVVGMSSLGNEVCKNILLAGIKHLTILDDSVLTEEDCEKQFFSTKTMKGQNRAEAALPRAKELNPMVDVVADQQNIDEKSEDFFRQFDVVCLTECATTTQVKVNKIVHNLGGKFISGNIFGCYGYMFSDLGVHSYMEEVVKKTRKETNGSEDGESNSKKTKMSDETETEYVEKTSTFCTLEDALNVPLFEKKSLRQVKQVTKTYLVMKVLLEFQKRYGYFPKKLESNKELEKLLEVRNDVFELICIDNDLLSEDFTSFCVGTLFPVCPIIGGVMSQEIIKAVSKKDPPHNNFFFYDGVSTSGVVENISKKTNVGQSGDEKPKHAVIEDTVIL